MRGAAGAPLVPNGAPADNVLGQPDFASFGAVLSQNGMGGPTGLAFDNVHKRLFVATGSTQHRILVYDLSGSIANNMNAAWILGQPDFVTGTADTQDAAFGCNTPVNACGVNAPGTLFYDAANERLFVSDIGPGTSTGGRILIYELAGGITNGMPAAHVLGQPDLVTRGENTPNARFGCAPGLNACGMSKVPSGLWYDDASKRLYFADLYNYRVLVYDLSSGITNGMPAAHVLGQATFTTRTGNLAIPANGCDTPVNACGMTKTREVLLDAETKQLFVNDSSENYRVLVFDVGGGISDGMAAAKVLGQPSLTSGTRNAGNPAAGGRCTTPVNGCGFDTSTGMLYDATARRFYLADTPNHRIMMWDFSSGITNGMPATNVIGHADLNTGDASSTAPPFFGGEQYKNPTYFCTTTPNACSLGYVNYLAFDETRRLLFASDFNANRVLVYGPNVIGGVCGNGIVEDGESCDDGNKIDGDCCSNDCKPRNVGGQDVCNDGRFCTDDYCTPNGCAHRRRATPWYKPWLLWCRICSFEPRRR